MRRAALLLALCSACAGTRALGPDATDQLQALARRGALPLSGALGPQALAPIADRLDTARVLALGRPLAGGREFAGLAQSLFFALVERHGFTGLALDIGVETGFSLDAWARGGPGELESLMLQLDEPALRSAEVGALLAAIRAHNTANPTRALAIHGLEPGDPNDAAGAVIAYFEKVDPAYVSEARAMLRGGVETTVTQVLRRLDERRDAYIAASSRADYSRARLRAEVAAQSLERAESMSTDAHEFHRAKNLDWALQQDPQGKLLLWAENARVAADIPGAAPSAGELLRQWYGVRYVAVAGVFVRGRALLELAGPRLCALELPPAPSGSFDASFAALDVPAALISVGALLSDPTLARSLRTRPAIRAIEGAYDPDDAARYTDAYRDLGKSFDALLVVPTVDAAAPHPALGRADASGCVELL